MNGSAISRGARDAGLYLRDLLLHDATYRNRWLAQSDRSREGVINNLAVAKVIARYVQQNPTATRGYETEASKIKDTVANALKGARLSPETLNLFIDSFGMSDADAHMLKGQLRGTRSPLVIVGSLEQPSELRRYRKPMHETIMLHEHHWIGANGRPQRHRSQIMLRSLVDGLRHYQYTIDTPHAQISVEHGGGVEPLIALPNRLWTASVQFPQPLSFGETHYLEFWTDLHYTFNPRPELRRGSHVRTGNVDMRVQFDRSAIPAAVFWAEWKHYQEPDNVVVSNRAQLLDAQLTVHRYLAAIERALVGVRWEW